MFPFTAFVSSLSHYAAWAHLPNKLLTPKSSLSKFALWGTQVRTVSYTQCRSRGPGMVLSPLTLSFPHLRFKDSKPLCGSFHPGVSMNHSSWAKFSPEHLPVNWVSLEHSHAHWLHNVHGGSPISSAGLISCYRNQMPHKAQMISCPAF